MRQTSSESRPCQKNMPFHTVQSNTHGNSSNRHYSPHRIQNISPENTDMPVMFLGAANALHFPWPVRLSVPQDNQSVFHHSKLLIASCANHNSHTPHRANTTKTQ